MKNTKGMSCIYCIVCQENGKYYVGQSVNHKTRWIKHLAELKAGKHQNKTLQNCFNKYGQDSLSFHVVCYVNDNDLTGCEQRIVDSLVASDPSSIMNHCLLCVDRPKGLPAWNKGKRDIYSEETKERIRIARAKQVIGPHSEEHKAKISAAQKGRVFTAEHKAKLRAAKMGNTNGSGNKGMRHSEETKAKMSVSHKGWNAHE